MITYRQFINAMERNGLPQTFNKLIKRAPNSDEVIGGCAIGQALYNLDKEGVDIDQYFFMWNHKFDENLKGKIITLNDLGRLPIQKIVDTIRIEFVDLLDKEIEPS